MSQKRSQNKVLPLQTFSLVLRGIVGRGERTVTADSKANVGLTPIKKISRTIIFLVILTICGTLLVAGAAGAEPSTTVESDDTIQDAIDNSSAEDIIYVENGVSVLHKAG